MDLKIQSDTIDDVESEFIAWLRDLGPIDKELILELVHSIVDFRAKKKKQNQKFYLK